MRGLAILLPLAIAVTACGGSGRPPKISGEEAGYVGGYTSGQYVGAQYVMEKKSLPDDFQIHDDCEAQWKQFHDMGALMDDSTTTASFKLGCIDALSGRDSRYPIKSQ